ncbi:glycosyltransferase family 2 protein [Erythrobacter sp. NFXS35]|uniref:glycosyltransferase family 2 protein n=1 Tax=Erythrobacter sp. NFXS35 TaxID=2818436 RepID=UPI0032E0382D
MNAVTPFPGPQPDELELTIVMPCLNEAETIEVCVRKAVDFLERSAIRGEVLVADNGSTDGSQELAKRSGARVVAVEQKGYGAALLGGIAAARGEYIIMGDADDSYDFSALQPFVEELRRGADLVMGNRFKGGIAQGAMPPLHRFLGNPVLSWLGRRFFSIPVGDFHCGLRGFRRDSIGRLQLQSPGMEFASEMVVKASLGRMRISEVPTTLSCDGRSRAPHLRTWRDGWRHLRFLLLHSPRWLFMYPGMLMFVLGCALVAMLAFGPLEVASDVVIDTHTLVAGCFLIIVGAQLILFSMLARRYAAAEGVLPDPLTFGRVMRILDLERLVLIGSGFAVTGLLGAGVAVFLWAARDFGPIVQDDVMRVLTISLTLVVIGIQLVASSFLSSLFEIRNRSRPA